MVHTFMMHHMHDIHNTFSRVVAMEVFALC